MRRLSILVFLAVSACETPTDLAGRVRFELPSSAVIAGDTLVATLENQSDIAIGYNLCYTGFDVRRGTGWANADRVFIADPGACLDYMAVMESGQSDVYQAVVPDSVRGGTYRIHIHVYPRAGSARVIVTSKPFQVFPGS